MEAPISLPRKRSFALVEM